MATNKLTHFDAAGRALMVDVAEKEVTSRCPRLRPDRNAAGNLRQIASGGAKKGDVLGVARIAAIQAAKRTSKLIPLCHPIPLTKVTVDFKLHTKGPAVECTAIVETLGRTGVEMEALTAVSVGLLTIYDMCKAVDRGMRVEGVGLLEKQVGVRVTGSAVIS